MLEDIVFPSMEPVYRGHAVTAEERADLVAFLAESARRARRRGSGSGSGRASRLAMGAFLVAVVLVGRRGQAVAARARRRPGRTP